MENRIRPALTVALCMCAALGLTGKSHAFTLHRIAASLDMSHIASSSALSGATISFDAHHAVVPAVTELTAPSTEIEVRIPTECDVEIQVIDEAGVRVSGARVHMPAGVQKLGFCGRDAQGRALPNGLYYYNVIVGDDVSTTRVVIVR
ncbi:MAG TPA: hypothetical protein VEC56_09530 [Candidatus Krumholzibacteria bacterium]|nr:hypothetical protein [Candidatus Krumholzibacteria bacterium]